LLFDLAPDVFSTFRVQTASQFAGTGAGRVADLSKVR